MGVVAARNIADTLCRRRCTVAEAVSRRVSHRPEKRVQVFITDEVASAPANGGQFSTSDFDSNSFSCVTRVPSGFFYG